MPLRINQAYRHFSIEAVPDQLPYRSSRGSFEPQINFKATIATNNYLPLIGAPNPSVSFFLWDTALASLIHHIELTFDIKQPESNMHSVWCLVQQYICLMQYYIRSFHLLYLHNMSSLHHVSCGTGPHNQFVLHPEKIIHVIG